MTGSGWREVRGLGLYLYRVIQGSSIVYMATNDWSAENLAQSRE